MLAGCPADGLVLDPFTGSGTTGVVALKNGRNFVGCELNPQYVEMAKGRIKREGIRQERMEMEQRMNSPYLIIDRSGNAVDINSTEPPTCHDHYRTCHGCPDRVAEPRCHTTCDGVQGGKAGD